MLSCCVCWLPIMKRWVMCDVKIPKNTVPDQKAMMKTIAAKRCSQKSWGTTSSMPPANCVRAHLKHIKYLSGRSFWRHVSSPGPASVSIHECPGVLPWPTAHQRHAMRWHMPSIATMSLRMSPNTTMTSEGNRSMSMWMISPIRAKRKSRIMRMMRKGRDALPMRATPEPAAFITSSAQSTPTTRRSKIIHVFAYLLMMRAGRISTRPLLAM
mmetsp:Transcript_38262/g.103639  ORF Transcript_38262/g.103639 Transcript_38262/m.103639 type:complete len:212 (-) Transcript_38262:219-854(-)